MNIEIAKYSGYCFGVKRALDFAEETLKKYKNKNKRIYTLGSIIHNPGVVKELSKKGIKVVKSLEEILPESVFIVRSHGMSPLILEELAKKKVIIVDATCPFVKKAHDNAKFLSKNEYFVIIIGSKNHPEVKGIKDYVKDNKCLVVENKEDIDNVKNKKKVGIVVQTTQTSEKFKLIISSILEKAKEILIFNTICNTTSKRQISTEKLAKKTDLVLIVGGKNSANTTHLAEISRLYNNKTYHIENYKEIKPEWFKNVKKVGISGGASTPLKDILEIKGFLEKWKKITPKLQ